MRTSRSESPLSAALAAPSSKSEPSDAARQSSATSSQASPIALKAGAERATLALAPSLEASPRKRAEHIAEAASARPALGVHEDVEIEEGGGEVALSEPLGPGQALLPRLSYALDPEVGDGRIQHELALIRYGARQVLGRWGPESIEAEAPPGPAGREGLEGRGAGGGEIRGWHAMERGVAIGHEVVSARSFAAAGDDEVPPEVVVLATEIEVGQIAHVHLEHDRLARVDALAQRLLGRGVARATPCARQTLRAESRRALPCLAWAGPFRRRRAAAP